MLTIARRPSRKAAESTPLRVRKDFRLPPDLVAEVAENAAGTHRTETAVIERALRAYLSKKENWK